MNKPEFEKRSSELRTLTAKIPLHWGAVQNDSFDKNINMFEINSYELLESAISHLDELKKNYFRRRWYIWSCSQCDEYLFTVNAGAEPNPNPKDKTYDVMFLNTLCFDVKGTVIPFSLSNDVEAVISDPNSMITFFYTQQSRCVRNCLQNRLFIVHHSFVDSDREFYLRCAWETKRKLYKFFVDNFSDIVFNKFNDCVTGIIYLIEYQENVITCIIDGLNNNKPITL